VEAGIRRKLSAGVDFLCAHDYSYTVQKSLFKRPQALPCRLNGWTPCRDVTSDVREISARMISRLPLGNNAKTTASELTIILPTHNRVDLCKAQVRFLQRWGVRHRVIVADSSDLADDGLRQACTGLVEYRRFDPKMPPGIKFAQVARSIATPYVATMTDDDINFPHAIDACLDYLQCNPAAVVAQGYVLGFSAIERTIDIHSMRWFIGSITEATPLRRLYELMRRYQPFYWAVFRTKAYVKAMDIANASKGAFFFQELSFAATLTLLGNAARLPVIHTLRGDEDSHIPPAEAHPFYWFLKDPRSFFAAYIDYRERIVNLLHELESGSPKKSVPFKRTLFHLARLLPRNARVRRGVDNADHVIDIIHATYFGREVDTGIINHQARILLGDVVGPLPLGKPVQRDLAIGPDDVVNPSTIAGRSYVWRNAVLNSELGSEITFSPEEIAQVEAALDAYLPPIASVSEVLAESLIASEAEQWATAENVSLHRSNGIIRVTETSGYGHHRLLGRIDGGSAGRAVTFSILAKQAGCGKIKIELHDDGAGQYVTSSFDLRSGDKSTSDGSLAQSSISPAAEGFFHLSLSLVPTANTRIHFTVAFIDANNAVVYPGRAGKAVMLRKLDMEGLQS
jgi:glycosyltransferase domain-containing protein